jgi:L-threonylcarbamoyladenylate synthase
MTVKTYNDEVLNQSVALLNAGECVAIPTETVYGLAGDATNSDAVARIFETKGRPSFNPLISHFYSLNHVCDYVDLDGDAKVLAQHFWPGAMTLIVNRRADCTIHDLTCAGLNTIAIRVPNHKITQDIIRTFNKPLAAPSANASGEVSPTSAIHVAESLGDKVPLIIADKNSKIGLESTVIDCTGTRAIILRPGAITADQCADVLGYTPDIDLGNHDAPKSPGQLLKHYAPSKPVRLKAYDVNEGEALLAFGSTKFMNTKNTPDDHVLNLSEAGDLFEAASNLFAYLRKLDHTTATSIAVMDIPTNGIGLAINDRLTRAAEK